MKTLDEVIEKIEKMWVCPSSDEAAEYCDFMEVKEDALHYLREYRSDKLQWEAEKKQYEDNLSTTLREFDEARDKLIAKYKELDIGTLNDPLDWDELRQMEGKPVWVELKRKETEVGRKAWGLNDGTYIDAFGYDIITIKVLHDLWHLSKAQLGQTWKAYRKERK